MKKVNPKNYTEIQLVDQAAPKKPEEVQKPKLEEIKPKPNTKVDTQLEKPKPSIVPSEQNQTVNVIL